MPHLEDYKLEQEMDGPNPLSRRPAYQLTIPLEAPPGGGPMNRRGLVQTHLSNLDHTLTMHDIVTRREGTVMIRLSDFELDIIADMILKMRSERQYA